jgi:hypothetical protein
VPLLSAYTLTGDEASMLGQGVSWDHTGEVGGRLVREQCTWIIEILDGASPLPRCRLMLWSGFVIVSNAEARLR